MRLDIMAAAFDLAERGWDPFPVYGMREGSCTCSAGNGCHKGAGKHPVPDRGHHEAAGSRRAVEELWACYAERVQFCNLGAVPPAGCIVLDVDPRHDGDLVIERWEEEFGPLPTTVVSRTGGGGWHYLYVLPGGDKRRLRTKALNHPAGDEIAGVDIKSRPTGYAVVAPSLHASGKYYRWDGVPFGEVYRGEPALAPSWLLELVTHVYAPSRPRKLTGYRAAAGHMYEYGQAALAGEVDKVASAEEGSRNNTLYASAAALGGLVPSGVLDFDEVVDALWEAAEQAGLDDLEIERTIESGMRRGLDHPR